MADIPVHPVGTKSQLLEQLESLRRRVRRRLLAYGICTVLGGGVAAWVTIVTVDWLIWLPAVLRMFVAAVFLIGFVAATWRWIIGPLHAHLGVDEIAARLERHFPHLRDRLSSTVNFLNNPTAGSPRMIGQVIANTDELVSSMSLHEVLVLRPLIRQMFLLVFAVTIVVGVTMTSSSWVRTGLYRYIYPFGEIDWPRRVAIQPLTGHDAVPIGESFTVKLRVDRGLTDSLRCVVRLKDPKGNISSLAMQRDDGHRFFATIDVVTSDLQYWFEAGDATTKKHPFTLQAVRRPEVVSLSAQVYAPSYAKEQAPRDVDFSQGSIEATIGGKVVVQVRASKPIRLSTGDSKVGLRLTDATLLPLVATSPDQTTLTATLEIRNDISFRVELQDNDGLSNRGGLLYAIHAIEDAPPTVLIERPQATVEVTPHGQVDFYIRASDDFGLASLQLVATGSDDAKLFARSLQGEEVHEDDKQRVVRTAKETLSLENFPLQANDTLRLEAIAVDNRNLDAGGPQTSRSSTVLVRIISQLEFSIRLRDELARMEDHIRRISLDQSERIDDAQMLRDKLIDDPDVTLNQREAALALADKQARLVRRLREVRRRMSTLVERMVSNQSHKDQSAQQVGQLERMLGDIADGPMSQARSFLRNAAEKKDADTSVDDMHDAVREQQQAVAQLQQVLRDMSQWGNYRGLIVRTRDLLDRQGQLHSETSEFGKRAMGKTVDELSQPQAADLKRIERRQTQLGEDVAQLLAHMNELRTSIEKKDQSTSDAMDAALRAIRSHRLQKHLRDAVKAIQSNRTAAANIEQKKVAEGIGRMIQALRQRDTRELARLQKEATKAIDQVTELLQQQRQLQRATEETISQGEDEQVLGDLSQQQRQLRRNTGQLSRELADVERLASASRLVQSAANVMHDAQQQLVSDTPNQATISQEEAINILEEALARLEKANKQFEQESMRRHLAQIREDMEKLRAAQVTVNDRVITLHEQVEKKKRVTRREAREASKLAKSQASVRALLDELLPDMEKVPVYDWVLRRVAGWMDTSRDWLNTRKIDTQLVETTARILRELDQLIAAIKETQEAPIDTEFAEAEGGGGRGQGGSMTQKPIPTMAELIVLKAMQVSINERTIATNERVDWDDPTELDLRQLTIIAEDQAEVQLLTDKLTTKARH